MELRFIKRLAVDVCEVQGLMKEKLSWLELIED